jgi:hypothetical protein
MSRREPGKVGRCFVRELILCQETAPAADDVCRKVGDKGHVTFREEVGFKEDVKSRQGRVYTSRPMHSKYARRAS